MKKQLLVAIIGCCAVVLLFIFGKTVHKKPSASPTEASVPAFQYDAVLSALKGNLTPSQSAHITELEANLQQENTDAKISTHNALAFYWKDSVKVMEPFIYHLSEASKLENSEKSLNFAAHLILDQMRMQQDPAKVEWLTAITIDLFQRAIAINPNNDDYKVGLGSAYVFGRGRDGNPQATMEGIQTLLEVARRDSNNMKAQFVLGVGGMVSGQYDKAVERFLKVVEREPNNLEAIAYLADTYAALGKKEEAIKWYNVSIKLADNPHYTEEVNARIRQLK